MPSSTQQAGSGPKIITPDISYTNAGIEMVVEIYPHETAEFGKSKNVFQFIGSRDGILSATITRSVRAKVNGTFQLNIAPGGPSGPAGSTSWTSVISPMSLVIISIARGKSRKAVMVGVVLAIEETQTWVGGVVRRTIQITGNDFSYFFSAFSYYTMAYLGLLQAGQFPVGTALGAAGYIIGLFGGKLQGTPVNMGAQWFNRVMVGPFSQTVLNALGGLPPKTARPPAVLEGTTVRYKGDSIHIGEIFGYWFEQFLEAGTVAFIPYFTDLMNQQGAWIDKFLEMFQWPWYEFFVTTATEQDFPIGKAATNPSDSEGYAFIPGIKFPISGDNPAFPMVVARVNPLPWAGLKVKSGQPTGEITWHSERWDNLVIYSLDPYSYLQSSLAYSLAEVQNFYLLQTTDIRALVSSATQSGSMLWSIELLGVLLDRGSINSYGFRPFSLDTRWMTILAPNVKTPDIDFMTETLYGKLASYFEPTPNMLQGNVVFPLWPEVRFGQRFRYKPFKNNEDYLFYIEDITHTYNFGGPSTTTLHLTRGLKVTDYASIDMMKALHTGMVDRINGNLTIRTGDPPGLSYLSPRILAKTGFNISPYKVSGVV